ncbi:MAG: hypothetical protein R3F61_13790 [Myxococcota bacterium]
MHRLSCALALVAPAAAMASAPTELALGYHGDFVVHPGVAVRGGVRAASTGPVALWLEGESDVFWHPRNRVAFVERLGPSVRWSPGGASLGAFAHIGVEQGVWASPTYRVDDGDVRGPRVAGDVWALVALGVDLGHRLSRSHWAEAWFVRPQAAVRFPTFYGTSVDVGIQLGVTL